MSFNSVTTRSWCAVDGNLAYTGTKEEIVNQVCKFWYDEDNRLTVQFKFYKPIKYYSYGDSWSAEEKRKDSIKFIFFNLISARYKIYRDIGF